MNIINFKNLVNYVVIRSYFISLQKLAGVINIYKKFIDAVKFYTARNEDD